MRERIAIALGVVLVVGGLALALASSSPRLASSNSEWPVVRTLSLGPGAQRCSGGLVTTDARSLVIWAGTAGPLTPLDVGVRGNGRRAAVGRFYLGGPMRARALPLGPRIPRSPLATVCARNAGRVAAVVGWAAAPNWTSRASTGDPRPGMRVDVYRRGAESGFGIATTAVRRAALFKSSLIAPWVVWAMLGAVLVAAALAAGLVARGERRT